MPADVAQARMLGASGIGLYRTEFMFMQRRELPSEDEQKQRALDDAVEFIRGCVRPDYMSAQGLSGQEMQTMTVIQSMWSYCLLYRYKADFTS